MKGFILSILTSSIWKWIGAAVVTVKLCKLIKFISIEVYARIRNYIGFDFPWNTFGKWAVVTGGTDGIGKAYAEELAERGFNICIISRNVEKLRSVAAQLEENYQVATKVINVDFTGPEIYKEIDDQLATLEGNIGVLVNNVGMSYKYAEYFLDVPGGSKFLWDMIHSNASSCTMMMKLVIPKMKNKGVIINVSSLMALYPMPLLSLYSACKVYVDHLSRALQYEYKNKGLTIQSVLPSYVATKMSSRKPNLEVPSAKTYVASAIKTVGIEDNTYGYLPHKIRGCVHEWLKENMPACFNLRLSMYFMQIGREKYYRRKMKMSQNAVEQS